MSPNESLFTYIYHTHVWGKYPGHKYFSGTGSYPETALPYIEYISKYIKDNKIQSVVDLGCGDFRVSRMINLGEANYLGIDIVKDLISFNQRQFSSQQIQFLHRDIVNDELIGADLCLYNKEHPPNEEVKKGWQRNNGLYLELPPFNCKIESLLIYPDLEFGTFFRLVKLISFQDK
jgi:SAM-dependent methyltransferase